MPWDSSDRRARLPDNWSALVREVKRRDGNRCRWILRSGKRCPRRGTDVDHRWDPDSHDLGNLWLLCPHHHKQKTAREAALGKARRRGGRNRPPEAHPGAR